MAIGETVFKETLRRMAWQRAKGELLSILETYWEEGETFPSVSACVKECIEKMEELV